MNRADYYQYQVTWSPEDDAYIARVTEFKGLAAHSEESSEDALRELKSVVEFCIKDLKIEGAHVPEPLSSKKARIGQNRGSMMSPPDLYAYNTWQSDVIIGALAILAVPSLANLLEVEFILSRGDMFAVSVIVSAVMLCGVVTATSVMVLAMSSESMTRIFESNIHPFLWPACKWSALAFALTGIASLVGLVLPYVASLDWIFFGLMVAAASSIARCAWLLFVIVKAFSKSGISRMEEKNAKEKARVQRSLWASAREKTPTVSELEAAQGRPNVDLEVFLRERGKEADELESKLERI